MVRGVDDAHPPAALAGSRAEEAHRSPYLLDGDDRAQLSAVASGAKQRQQVGVRLGRHPMKDRMRGINEQGLGCLNGRQARFGVGEHETGGSVSQCRLADAGGPADQPGMRHASATIGVKQKMLGGFVAHER
jgi:hypothetical protein